MKDTPRALASKIINRESFEWLKEQPDNTFDSVVTDPPYLISFMGKKWDSEDSVAGASDFWAEVLRVLKPGGHITVFSHSRTYHRVASAIEDAGFEIRDQIMWVYGSGFPKSHNIGKNYDKKMGNDRKSTYKPNNKNNVYGSGYGGGVTDKSKGNSPYEGWGTALKPSHEPIVLARKPLSEKTVVDNVIKWGTGGINIDGCRVGNETIISRCGRKSVVSGDKRTGKALGMNGPHEPFNTEHQGRFPANFIHDGSEEVLDLFPNTKGSRKARTGPKGGSPANHMDRERGVDDSQYQGHWPEDNGGSAARFFYSPKVSKKERNIGCDKNTHPTVKPVALMAYLARLITPKGGLVLDPFVGSGSTGMACKQEGFNFIGVDYCKEKDKNGEWAYVPYDKIARARIKAWNKKT